MNAIQSGTLPQHPSFCPIDSTLARIILWNYFYNTVEVKIKNHNFACMMPHFYATLLQF